MSDAIETFRPGHVSAEILAWARLHGLDPDEIPLGSEIVIDYENRRITHDRFVLGAGGAPQWENDWPVVATVTVQLESPPRPFLKEAHP